LAVAQIADPEELHVLDRFLPIKLVVRVSGPNLVPRNTEGSLQMTPSPCLRHTQQSNIWSHIPVIASQSRSRRAIMVEPELGLGSS